MGHHDFNKEFWVNVDALYKGLGGVLYQVNDKKKTVIAYATRTLHPIESQAKSSTFLELHAIKWLLTEPFKHFLLGAKWVLIFILSVEICYAGKQLNGMQWNRVG